eukprot:6193810-Pleurochrysis_carterae.AAC.3
MAYLSTVSVDGDSAALRLDLNLRKTENDVRNKSGTGAPASNGSNTNSPRTGSENRTGCLESLPLSSHQLCSMRLLFDVATAR